MELRRVPYIPDPSWLRLGKVQNKACYVSADVRTRWGVFSVGIREVSCEHRWARKDEVDFLRECNAEEIQGDVPDIYRKSGVPVMHGLMRVEM